MRTLPERATALHTILSQARRANFEMALKVIYPLVVGSVARKAELAREMREVAEVFQLFVAFIRPERGKGA